MWQTLPEFGTGVLYAILVCAAYTIAVSIAAGRGRPRLLRASRMGAYATCALIGLGILTLAYAFITHDFRIRYVARYSDRSMSTGYLFASLWGGQDGSLLWWSFLLSLYTAACVRWMYGKYRELQPYVIATLMVVISFFGVLMLFAANPFSTAVSGASVDGEGLNPLLQNYWMIIHPPSLYTGFVGCSVPFAFAIAALVTGRLDNEWIIAVRKWMLFAWLFLSIGNALGMVWAYEELGWGGYWAWDPVENAACLPWFAASAWVHSTMIQERRNMLKLWNVILICITFLLTIFGTFLTRSGLIASVHAFAQSNIGIFFVWFLGLTIASCAGLIVWRLPLLRSPARIESLASREAMFVGNNYVLLGSATFILIATTWPKISEWLWKESVTVGPPFFNRWMVPLGIVIFTMMGLAPLFGWRKTSGVSLKKAFTPPLVTMATVVVLHLSLGKRLGFPAIVESERFYPGISGAILQGFGAVAPLIVVALAGFNLAVIVQEFARGVAARRRSADKAGEPENILVALRRLIDKSRRRYGGYIVHIGVVLMFLGFTGKAWGTDVEASVMPGETIQIKDYELTYKGPRREVDESKMMIFADLEVTRAGKPIGVMHPGKFIYNKSMSSPTTEVAMRRSFRDDLYVVVGNANPETKRATFQVHVNPFVSWIWIGVLILICGASVSLWPEIPLKEAGPWAYLRTATAGAGGLMIAVWITMGPSMAYGATRSVEQRSEPARAGSSAYQIEDAALIPIAGAIALGGAIGIGTALRRRRRRT